MSCIETCCTWVLISSVFFKMCQTYIFITIWLDDFFYLDHIGMMLILIIHFLLIQAGNTKKIIFNIVPANSRIVFLFHKIPNWVIPFWDINNEERGMVEKVLVALQNELRPNLKKKNHIKIFSYKKTKHFNFYMILQYKDILYCLPNIKSKVPM